RPAEHAAPHAGEEAQGPLRLLRHHGELLRACPCLLRGQADLAEGARAPVAATPVVDEDAADPGAVSAASTAHRPPVRLLANLFSEEPGAGVLHARICGGPASPSRRATRPRIVRPWIARASARGLG